ncbi:hypothetical protein BGZ68_000766 [Mortierella alpina]|nr:hypothetical protein BGZ68_000766 [Mortierella alpina]
MSVHDEGRRRHGTSQEDAMAMDIDVMMAMLNGRKREEDIAKAQPWLLDTFRKGSNLPVERVKKQDHAEKRESSDPSAMDMDKIVERNPLEALEAEDNERDLGRDFNDNKQRTSWSEEKELQSLQEEEDNQGAERDDGIHELTAMAEEEEEEEEEQVLMDAEDRVYEAEEALEEAMEELQEERAEARDRKKGVTAAEQVEEEGDQVSGETEEEEGGAEREDFARIRDGFRDEEDDEDEDNSQMLEDDQLQAKYAGAEEEDEEEYLKGDDRLGQAGPSETMDDET